MHYPSYPFQRTEDKTQFFFESIGPKGIIQKVVLFSATDMPDIYNLGLGDYDPQTNVVDDLSVSHNGDTAKILSTIFHITDQYLITHPDRMVVFAGNTPSRNRLYRMAINQAYQELASIFSLFGYRNESWESFDTQQVYELYLIARK